MDIHRQTCQKCGSRNMRNLIAREEGQSDKVYVQCLDCKEFVARYVIARLGYYHHGKGFESFLKSLNRGGQFDSGKDVKALFEEVKESCEREFAEVLKKMEEMGKD